MFATDVFRPQQWNDFFLAVGGGAAALTGLVFVALSLNIAVLSGDATHRYRAIGTLIGFVSAFVISSLALMGGQNHVGVGTEWATLATAAGIVYVYGHVQASRVGQGRSLARTVTGTALCLVEVVGACIVIANRHVGLYIAAAAMVTRVAWLISGAWLLVVGAARD